MQLSKMDEELKTLVGEKKAKEAISFIREDALKTSRILDVYYKVLPNRKIYFFKRYLDETGKITVERMKDNLNIKLLEEIEEGI